MPRLHLLAIVALSTTAYAKPHPKDESKDESIDELKRKRYDKQKKPPPPTEKQRASCQLDEVWGWTPGHKPGCVLNTGPFQRRSGTIYPAYFVLTLVYAPPGIGSQVVYGTGSTTGSTTEVKHLWKHGVTAGSVGNIEVQAGFAIGGTLGGVWETHKEQNHTISLTSQVDNLDHEKDVFHLWVNPSLVVEHTAPTTVMTQLTPRDGEAMDTLTLTVAELRDPSKIPASKRPRLAHFKPSDYQNILKLDPLATPGTKPDLKRYTLEDTLQLEGPDSETDGISGDGYDLSSESVSGGIKGFVTETTSSITVGTKFSLFGLFEGGMKFGYTYEWDFEKAMSDTKGSKQAASAMLSTPTVGRYEVFEVYYDQTFKTFAFVSKSRPSASSQASLVGTVMKGGKPAANQKVTITLGKKHKRQLRTNAKGKFRAFDLDPGTHNVQVESRTQSVVVAKDHPAEITIDVPAK